jgi:pyridinium-3,5-biscarboxylic acid mononucleotide sulfurtransferase
MAIVRDWRYQIPMVSSAPNNHGSRLDELCEHIRNLGSALVCFSGGIDSALILAVTARELKERAVGLTAVSPSLPSEEKAEAERIAQSFDARLEFVQSNELDRPLYAQNGEDRCFHCKTELYDIAERKRVELGLNFILNGTNCDDLGDYRPGLDAARNASVRSPLLELGFSKADVRSAALEMGLDIWDKPAAACLASRIPYGTSVTRERLAQIEQFESGLKALGFRQVRVRWHEQIARIEVGIDELHLALSMRDDIVALGKASGFHYITLDLAGYRTGSHNELLQGKKLKLLE